MFALIDTKGATHIAINIPHEGADKTIPSLVGMLEQNAIFVHRSYNTLETRIPEMSIQLGDKLLMNTSGEELAITIPFSTSILDESFVNESPEVKISNKKAIEERDSKIQRLQLEVANLNQSLNDLKDQIKAMQEDF